MKNLQLPEWASLNTDKKSRYFGCVEIDPDVVYPKFLKAMKAKPTQNSLECARRCFTRALKETVKSQGGGFLHIHILKRDKWALKNYPEGEPLNWRAVYREIAPILNLPIPMVPAF